MISKPLQPVWVTRESRLPPEVPSYPEFHPVVLCTASRRVVGAEASVGGYIQGAADDTENWARGLTSSVFWQHEDILTKTSEADMPGLIEELVSSTKSNTVHPAISWIRPSSNIGVGPLAAVKCIDVAPSDLRIDCTEKPDENTRAQMKERYLHLRCVNGKLGYKDLRKELFKLEPFLDRHLRPDTTVVVCCESGMGLSIGVALALLCLYIDDEGSCRLRIPFPHSPLGLDSLIRENRQCDRSAAARGD